MTIEDWGGDGVGAMTTPSSFAACFCRMECSRCFGSRASIGRAGTFPTPWSSKKRQGSCKWVGKTAKEGDGGGAMGCVGG